jgi:ribonucleotide reductase alpha subunit
MLYYIHSDLQVCMVNIPFFPCSGEFVVVNKHLLHDLTEMGVWTPALKNQIIYEDGSVQKIKEIPDDLKAIYKYVIQSSISLYPKRCN